MTTLREILKSHATKQGPKLKRYYIRETGVEDGPISSECAYISRFAQPYDNQKVVEQITRYIMAMAKRTDVAVSVIAISED